MKTGDAHGRKAVGAWEAEAERTRPLRGPRACWGRVREPGHRSGSTWLSAAGAPFPPAPRGEGCSGVGNSRARAAGEELTSAGCAEWRVRRLLRGRWEPVGLRGCKASSSVYLTKGKDWVPRSPGRAGLSQPPNSLLPVAPSSSVWAPFRGRLSTHVLKMPRPELGLRTRCWTLQREKG